MNSTLSLLKSASATNPLRRALTVQTKTLDKAKGIVRFVASDETLDCYNEIVRVNGWRFTHFDKNAPFVDSHDYSSISKCLGQVIARNVEGGQLVEDVQFALTSDGQTFADWGFKMVDGGFLKAVSVGFFPKRYATKWDSDKSSFLAQVEELGLTPEQAAQLCVVYLEQEQIELSLCVIGANPNALAKAYKAGVLSEQDVDNFAAQKARLETVSSTQRRAAVDEASPRARQLALLAEIQNQLSK